MKPNIAQHVAPRRHAFTAASRRSVSWGRSLPRNRFTRRPTLQSGGITSATVTLTFGTLALGLLATLGFVYLQQVLNTASQGGDVQALESHITSLKEKQRELELEGAKLRSLETVEGNIQKLNLVAANQVSFLATPTIGKVAAVVD